MGKIQRPSNFSNLTSFKDLVKFLSGFVDALYVQFNGNIDFVDNIKASGPSVVVFPNNTDVVGVDHGLGQLPNGYLVVSQSAAGSIFVPSGYNWTSSRIYLQASAALNATIYVI